MFNPIKWLLTKSTPESKETIVSDLTASDSATNSALSTDDVTAQSLTPAVAVKTSVKDFEAAFNFVERGIAQLGEAAKEEMKALAMKYL
ncbi:hypothetical protein ACQV2B_02945 [Pantoea allii]|uniref:hypothetical protein n=1 Tax=Pantoea allii TaxID=574096 RepID=UPI003D3172FB